MSEEKIAYTSIGFVGSFMFISIGIGMIFHSMGAGLFVFGLLILIYILFNL